MNSYAWYFIFNLAEFEALGLISKVYTLVLDGIIGQKEIMVTKGNYVGITYEGIFLPLELNDKAPFEFEDMAIDVHENGNVFLGFKT